MELDDLKNDWQNLSGSDKNESEIQSMLKLTNHPKVRRIRAKLIIETILLIVFISIYNTAFDGFSKAFWANTVLISGTMLYIIIDIYGYVLSQNIILADNLKDSISKLLASLKRYSVIQTLGSIIFGISVLLFFTSSLEFTFQKYLILGGMLISLFIMAYLSWRNWQTKISFLHDLILGLQ